MGHDLLKLIWSSWLSNAFCASVAILAGGLTLLFLYQDKLLYFPCIPGAPKLVKDNPSGYRSPKEYGIDYEDLMISTIDGLKIHAWLMKHECSFTRPTIIFFHGNAGNIGFRLPNVAQLHRKTHCNVLLVDYRGYGNSEGYPNESGLRCDADAALEFLRSRKDIDPTKIILFGRSLGGAVAVYLAGIARKQVAGVILENTFLSISSMVDEILPFLRRLKPLILRIDWDNEKKIVCLQQPVLFIAGDADELVPRNHMIKLHDILKQHTTSPVSMYIVKNGTHNDTWLRGGDQYFREITEFVLQILRGPVSDLDSK